MVNEDVHEQIRRAARANAATAPDYFTTRQREVLQRTFVPALHAVRRAHISPTLGAESDSNTLTDTPSGKPANERSGGI